VGWSVSLGPTVCVVEGLFYAQNLQTAIVLARPGREFGGGGGGGSADLRNRPPQSEAGDRGYGAAGKFAVAKMVQRMLNLAEPPAPDAADALALALTYAHEQGRFALGLPKAV